MYKRALLNTLLVLSLIMLSYSTVLAEETTVCTPITSLPAVITTQGVYCFNQHLSTAMSSGTAISIEANNVTINFNGYKLGGLAAGASTQAVGVSATNRDNIVLLNGNIRGFRQGIVISGGAGHKIIGNTLDGNFQAAILVSGAYTLIENNDILNTGGAVGEYIYGINVGSASSVVRNNYISGIFSDSDKSVFGINTTNDYNIVTNNKLLSGLTPNVNSYGLYVGSGSHGSIFIGNQVTSFDTGITVVSFMGNNGTALFRDSLLNNCTTNYDVATAYTFVDGGGNVPAKP